MAAAGLIRWPVEELGPVRGELVLGAVYTLPDPVGHPLGVPAVSVVTSPSAGAGPVSIRVVLAVVHEPGPVVFEWQQDLWRWEGPQILLQFRAQVPELDEVAVRAAAALNDPGALRIVAALLPPAEGLFWHPV